MCFFIHKWIKSEILIAVSCISHNKKKKIIYLGYFGPCESTCLNCLNCSVLLRWSSAVKVYCHVLTRNLSWYWKLGSLFITWQKNIFNRSYLIDQMQTKYLNAIDAYTPITIIARLMQVLWAKPASPVVQMQGSKLGIWWKGCSKPKGSLFR